MVFDGSVAELCYTSHSSDADDVWESDDDSTVGTTTPCNQLPPPPVLSSSRRQPDVFTGIESLRHSYDSKSQTLFGTASRRQESPAGMGRASLLLDRRPNNNATHGTTTSNYDSVGMCPNPTSSIEINKQTKQYRSNEDSSASCSSSWNSSTTLLMGASPRSFRARTSTWSGATNTYERHAARAANLRIIPPAENEYDDEPLAYSCPSRVSSEMKRCRKPVNYQQGPLSSSPAETVSGWVHLPHLQSRRTTASSTTEASHQPSCGSSSCVHSCTANKRKEGVRFSIDKCSVSLPSIEPEKRVSKDYSSSPTKSDAEKRRVSIGEQVAEYATRLSREGKFSGQTVCPKWVAQHAFEYALTNPTNFRV